MGQDSPFDDLHQEHVQVLADMKTLSATVGGLSAGSDVSWAEESATLRDQLEIVQRGLKLHFRREEEGLFPFAQQAVAEGAKGPDILASFFAEEAEDDIGAHGVLNTRTHEMLSLLSVMQQAERPDSQSLAHLRTLVSLSSGLFERHAAKEDKLVFPMIQRSLSPQQIEGVAARLQQFQSGADLTGEADADLRGLGMDEV